LRAGDIAAEIRIVRGAGLAHALIGRGNHILRGQDLRMVFQSQPLRILQSQMDRRTDLSGKRRCDAGGNYNQ
jgi:hypothetical protein